MLFMMDGMLSSLFAINLLTTVVVSFPVLSKRVSVTVLVTKSSISLLVSLMKRYKGVQRG